MNFEFADELLAVRDGARSFLAKNAPTAAVRRVLDGEAPYDAATWRAIGELGWLGAAIPEELGGSGLGHEGLCVLAEEIGAAVAAIPFTSACMAAEAILLAGDAEQQRALLPGLATGETIFCLALAEGPGNPHPRAVKAEVRGGRLTGTKWPVADGGIADRAVVVAGDADGGIGLFLVELAGPGVTRTALESLDPTRNQARLDFAGAPALPLPAARGWAAVEAVLERSAVPIAFEQIGGARACLDMARDFAMERHAFGRPIASFQAIKHKLVDIYVANELARSNCYYAAWALGADAPDLSTAAAAARVSATEAFHLASKENIQVHGGMGFTWAADCHLYYRRAKLLSLMLGGAPWWKDRLVTRLELTNADQGA
ncbi:MAG: acyl-CoA/acyl-ACP dehydrogenase [Acetobacteraceae bacterium]|nr:acyl-CoA/acyl-ACP dehydrogenase [Acetobacteraceae bacterium]